MVVDDEEDILQVVKAALMKYGHKVDAFSTPVEALNYFDTNHKDYKLVISDVRMPGMSGIEFARRIKELYPEILILLMTAFEFNEREISKHLPFIRIGDLLKKPFDLSRICKVIDEKLITEH